MRFQMFIPVILPERHVRQHLQHRQNATCDIKQHMREFLSQGKNAISYVIKSHSMHTMTYNFN